MISSVFCTAIVLNSFVAYGSAKYFKNFTYCAVCVPDKTIYLSQTPAYNLNSGIPNEVFCTWKCRKDPQCLHFNYKIGSESCELFYSDQTSFEKDDKCMHFQVSVLLFYIVIGDPGPSVARPELPPLFVWMLGFRELSYEVSVTPSVAGVLAAPDGSSTSAGSCVRSKKQLQVFGSCIYIFIIISENNSKYISKRRPVDSTVPSLRGCAISHGFTVTSYRPSRSVSKD